MIIRIITALLAGLICYALCTMVGNWIIAIQMQTGATVLAADVLQAKYIFPAIVSVVCAVIVYAIMKDEEL